MSVIATVIGKVGWGCVLGGRVAGIGGALGDLRGGGLGVHGNDDFLCDLCVDRQQSEHERR